MSGKPSAHVVALADTWTPQARRLVTESLMNIVCACDGNFIAHLATMLLSLAENNGRHKPRIFIICDGLLPGQDKLAAMLHRCQVEHSFIPIEGGFLQGLFVNFHITRAAYARLLMSELLPSEIGRVLYLDCDLIVRGDLGELWNVDLAGKTVGAVREVTNYIWHSKLGLPVGAPYFNNGVMLIDLDRWRKLNIGHRSLDFAREHPDRVQWWDQCALNLNLYDDWIPLDAKWNFQTMEIGAWDHGIMRFERMNSRTRHAIRIVHFTTGSKPWHYLNYHPLKEEYLEYRRRTPWPLEKFEDCYPHNMMRLFLHRYFPPLLPIYLAARKIV